MFYRPINDIHREFDRFYFQRYMKKRPNDWHIYEPTPLNTDKNTVLGIAGDIDTRYYTVDFLVKMAARFKAVVCVLGNHDYWRRDLTTWPQKMKGELAKAGVSNVHVLARETVVIDGVRFIGSTLWTDFNKGDNLVLNAAQETMNDYKFMRKMDYSRLVKPLDLLAEHHKDRDFIFSFANNEERMVVLSHHAPSWKSVDFSRYGIGPINSLYATEFGNEISYSNFNIWHHGHIHTFRDYLIYNTRIICNPRGYFFSDLVEGFDDSWLIDLDSL